MATCLGRCCIDMYYRLTSLISLLEGNAFYSLTPSCPSSLYGAARCTYESEPEDMGSSSQAVKVEFFHFMNLYMKILQKFRS